MFFQCHVCHKYLRTEQGLKSHQTRLKHQHVSSQTHTKSLGNPPPATLVPAEPPSTQGDSGDVETGAEYEVNFASELAFRKCTYKILRRIPKGARIAAAEAYNQCINTCVSDNTEAAWKRLLDFPSRCFRIPDIDTISNTSLATAVKRNIAIFRTGSLQRSRADLVHPDIKIDRKPPHPEDRFAKVVEAKIADGDVKGAVRILCSEDTFAKFDDRTLQALRDLHPPHSESLDWSGVRAILPHPPIISETMIKGAIKSFPPGSAGGPDMLRPQHLKDMTSHLTGTTGLRLISSLTDLCKLMHRGEVPQRICPILYGATLCALNKKKGGIRPIAIGCTLRRLAAKIGSVTIRDKMGELFQPTQLGFGIKGGAEAAAHAARRFISHHHEQEKVFLKLDFSNAFNMIRRDSILQVSTRQFPELNPFLYQCYRESSFLFFGEHLIPSQRGIQQGDPLGPALFCAVIHSLASSLRSELNLWYLDDGALGGDPKIVLGDLKKIARGASEIGLQLNYQKCELFLINMGELNQSTTKTEFLEAAPNISFPSLDELSLLGAPIKDEAIAKVLETKTTALSLITSRLKDIRAHTAFYILKNSSAIPKLVYTLRCAPVWRDKTSLQVFDATLKEALEIVSNTNLSEEAWEQSSLPVRKGGLGIRHAEHLALPAFLASAASVEDLTEVMLPLQVRESADLDQLEGTMQWERENMKTAASISDKTSQKEWEEPMVNTIAITLLERASNLQEKARLLSVTSPESGSFLNALPTTSLGTLLDNNSFRIALGLRLGTKIVQPHTCVCGKTVEEKGLHGLSCVKSVGRKTRHAEVNDLIKRGLSSAGFPATLEPAFLHSSNHLRPDGITQIPWRRGKALVWDFTCVDSQAACYLSSSSGSTLHAANEAEAGKRAKYAFLQQSHHFAPIAAECLGSFSKDSLKLISDIGKQISNNSGERRAGEFFKQRLSVAIQRGNALSVMGTIPRGSSMEEYLNLL